MNPKKKKKRTIVIDNKMLIQGYSTTMMRADNISLKQMQIFVGVIDKLQLLTRKMLNEGVKNFSPNNSPSLSATCRTAWTSAPTSACSDSI